jgi:energy-converting hydrogenase B subunit Q
MSNIALTIKTIEEKGVLDEITKIFSSHNINISYAHIYVEKNDYGSINVELENVSDIDDLIDDLNNSSFVNSIEIHSTLNDVYGKRILIFGGGAQVSQVALGAITEADRHNIRGERISIDTIPLVGEQNIAEAVDALSLLPRVKALVLAGSLMGGEITNAVRKVKKEHDLLVISLNMPGSVVKEADLVVTDPIQAGVMAVMAIANTAVFDVKKLETNKF